MCGASERLLAFDASRFFVIFENKILETGRKNYRYPKTESKLRDSLFFFLEYWYPLNIY
jgi:hypothetical protein